MTTPDAMTPLAAISDAELATASAGGDREAFGRIVERYQRLLCSLAYSATGRMSESQDIAQEAFIAAWQQLPQLREPEKLRPWLCGILRYKVSRLRRQDGREPVRQAEELDAAGGVHTADEPATDLAMQKEEQAILWSELERVPELYREPLILYYREHRSVEHVAAALDLTEDTVKQRLARGRKILQERVLAFVEGALARSTPGRVFTLSVLAALPAALPVPAKAVGIGATAAAHGSILAKWTGVAALLASATSVVHAVLVLRANLDQARTPRERRAVVKATLACFFGCLLLLGVIYALRASAYAWWDHRATFATLSQVLVVAFAVLFPVALVKMMAYFRRLRSSERRLHPEYFQDPRDQIGSAAGEYRSRIRLLGVPLVHMRWSSPDEGQPPVFGWFAGGDRAYGLICAWGGYAIAPISVGAFAVGLVTVGAVSIGVIGLGTCGIGLLAVGCLAIGVEAKSWLVALGWESAQSGGFAIARIAAEGPVAFAQHANDPVARELLANPHAQEHHMIFVSIMVLATIVPVAYYARGVRRRLGRRPTKA